MNKYFITFGAVALSFGAVYGAEAYLGEAQEFAAIGGTSVPVAEVDLLAPSADTQQSATVEYKGVTQLTPDVRGIVGEGDSRAVDGDSTNGNSSPSAVDRDLI